MPHNATNPASKEGAMVQWEYLEVTLQGETLVDSRGRSWLVPWRYTPDQHGMFNIKWRSFSPLVNALGAEGWIPTGCSDDVGDGYTIYFKRPRGEG
jgi:hypothetical protein